MVMVAGGLIGGIGLFSLGLINDTLQFLVVRLIVVTIGMAGISHMVSSVALSNWFVRKRGRVLGISGAGAGAGKIIITGMTRDRSRFELAKTLGADAIIDVEKMDPVEAVAEMTVIPVVAPRVSLFEAKPFASVTTGVVTARVPAPEVLLKVTPVPATGFPRMSVTLTSTMSGLATLFTTPTWPSPEALLRVIACPGV